MWASSLASLQGVRDSIKIDLLGIELSHRGLCPLAVYPLGVLQACDRSEVLLVRVCSMRRQACPLYAPLQEHLHGRQPLSIGQSNHTGASSASARLA